MVEFKLNFQVLKALPSRQVITHATVGGFQHIDTASAEFFQEVAAYIYDLAGVVG